MSLQQVCKQTSKRASKALFIFPKEKKTGIAPTRFIVGKDVDYSEGLTVHVNWEGKKFAAKILALSGVFILWVFHVLFSEIACS